MLSSEVENLTNIATNVMNQNQQAGGSDGTTTSGTNTSSDCGSGSGSDTCFAVGCVVDVQSRTWPGINKPGGTARVKSYDKIARTYCVSYMLGGKEDGVEAQYVSEHSDEPVTRKRRQTEITNVPAPVVLAVKSKRKPLAVVTSKEGESNTMKKVKKLKKPKKKKASVSVKSPTVTTSLCDQTKALDCDSSLVESNEFENEDYVEDGDDGEDDDDECESFCEDEEDDSIAEEYTSPLQDEALPLRGGAVTAMSLLHTALEKCHSSGDAYLAADIEQFILSESNGLCTSEDVEACFAKAEEENKIMVAMEDDGNRSVYKV